MAATYYLDAVNGNDAWPGTSSQPWQTLSKARSTVTAGDTIIIRSGSYGAYRDEGYGSNTDWITYKAEDGATPVLDYIRVGHWRDLADKYLRFEGIKLLHHSGNQPERMVYILNANHVKLIGIEIATNIGYGVHGATAIKLGSVNDVEIRDCYIGPEDHSAVAGEMDGFAKAIGAEARSNNVVINNCEIQGTGWKAVSIGGNNFTFTNNHLHNFDGDGLVIDNDNNNVLIENNHIHESKRSLLTGPPPAGSDVHPDLIQVQPYTGNENIETINLVIRNNIFHDGADQGLFLNAGAGSANWTIENNLIYNLNKYASSPWHLMVSGGVNGYVIKNNIVEGNIDAMGGTVTSLRNNIAKSINIYNISTRNIITIIAYGDETYNYAYRFNWATWYAGYYTQHPTSVDLANEAAFYALFNDPDNSDWTHASGSIAIGGADPNDYTPTDILEKQRDADPDAGCYEYGTTSILYGDVSGDGEVSAFDAALAAHIAVDLEHPDIKNRDAAEVSGDAEVTAYDAALIAQKAVGLIDKFPVEG